MESNLTKVVLLSLLIFTFLIPISQVAAGQELGAGGKLVGTTPFVFAEAKFWVLAVELGAGFSSGESESSAVDISLAGKLYPIKITNFSPYLGFSNHFSLNGSYNQSRAFGGVEFDFPGGGLPLSAFAGGGLAFTEAESAGLGWHLGVKYTF